VILSESPSLNSVCVHSGVHQTGITHQSVLLSNLYAIGDCSYQY